MSTHRRIEALCVACVIIACLVCAVAYALHNTVEDDASTGHQMGYEQTLFDTSKVHTIDIVMDDWDEFIESCENEEYASCTVVVDGESCKNVAIRAKGNTSLRNVSQLNSDRYSFKIEFDHYESSRTYHGLDKLSLNNIIQDNTYMKDYLTYTMMGQFGVDSPLTSYVYITVNGEDWGLYLAVESVEDSFLERVYGVNTGNLYKPDSMSFGGGRGNGQGFNMDEFIQKQEEEQSEEGDGGQSTDNNSTVPGTVQAGSFDTNSSTSSVDASADESKSPESSQGSVPSSPGGGAGGMGGGPGGGMGSADVKLQYIDDDPNSYQNIFDSAKTPVTEADKARLIESLRKLSEGEDLQEVLDMDQVLRYFVVHDYVCNGDSYTGSMIHNYYLRESDGKLSMIPWDYNLAFGGFAGGDATSQINAPIDDPTASGFGFGGGFSGFGQRNSESSNEESGTEPGTDPTKFCTYEEFQAGVDTLREFCALRSQSVQGQLDGTIPSTQEGQQEDSSALVDASGLTISNMGSMANGGADSRDGAEASGNDPREQSDERPSERPSNGFSTDGDFNPQTTRGFSGPGNNSGGLSPNNLTGWITLGVSLVVLACGMCVALCFRRA